MGFHDGSQLVSTLARRLVASCVSASGQALRVDPDLDREGLVDLIDLSKLKDRHPDEELLRAAQLEDTPALPGPAPAVGILGGLGGVPAEALVLSRLALAAALIWREVLVRFGGASSALLEGGARAVVWLKSRSLLRCAGGERRGDTTAAAGSEAAFVGRGECRSWDGYISTRSVLAEVIQHICSRMERAPSCGFPTLVHISGITVMRFFCDDLKAEPSTMFRQLAVLALVAACAALRAPAAPRAPPRLAPRRLLGLPALAAVQRPGGRAAATAEASQKAASRRRPPPACQRSCASTCRRQDGLEVRPSRRSSSASASATSAPVPTRQLGRRRVCQDARARRRIAGANARRWWCRTTWASSR